MELRTFSYLQIIMIFMLRINSFILNEPNHLCLQKHQYKIYNMFGFHLNFVAELISNWT